MKYIFIFFISICIIYGCSEQKVKKQFIKRFLNEIKSNKEFNFLDSKIYIYYGNMNQRKEEVVSLLINENIKSLRQSLNNNDSFKIYTHEQMIKNQINFNFNYKDYSNVFYIIGKNNEVITTIVINSKKIISFSYNIIKNKNKPRTPLLLNEI